jgi:4-hydroxy-tetrahydrodipicolinate synthase
MLHGSAAALLTPRREDGSIDFEALERNAEFVFARGASAIVPCGGTGEYFDLTLAQRREMVSRLVPVAKGKGQLIAGVGSGSLHDSVSLARHALDTGATAVLLPSPHFYRYGTGDLLQFFRDAARAIEGPTLLYNLAGFVSPLDADLAAELVGAEPHIIGIKDSSGGLEILRRLTLGGIPGVRIQGHDKWLPDSLRQGLVDAAISGPAGVVPEAIVAVFDTFGDEAAFSAATSHFDQFLQQLERFPYPWALKWAAQHRGLGPVSLPLPLSAVREREKAEFLTWFAAWLENSPAPDAGDARP